MSTSNTLNTEGYYKHQMEGMAKENKMLKHKLDTLERENKDLKKSIYDLSVRYDGLIHHMGKALAVSPFDIDSSLTPQAGGGWEESEGGASPVGDQSHMADSIQEGSSIPRKADERRFFHKYTLKGHTAAVYAVKYSPCGKFLATGGFDKSVRIWDSANQREASILKGHTHSVSEVSWSHDCTEIVSGGLDKFIRLWDVTRMQNINSNLTAGFVQSVVFHPSDLTTNRKTQTEENKDEDEDEDVIDVQGSLLLATGSADSCAYIFDSAKRGGKLMQRLEGHTDKVNAVDFHPTEPVLASCSADFTIRLWSPKKKIYS